ncbi:dienelactone hydrolase family protein [Chamaesiphon sp. GL140_3_metabinner_50]|uniref:alpha/beta hydrolase n=1 Tax=Chamaesiphon sp. GL140_3_metabinner_50 TaxID=2970812 RepID=UPI0025FC3EAF|nr:dienelactone hydrolase family protein [Chamaesiphon sp. GL140_3_metabinner_50]
MTQIEPDPQLDIIFVPARTDAPVGTIVLLHGWGANHNDLGDLVPYFDLPEYQFLFPNGIFDHEYSDDGKMWYSFTGAGQLNDRSLAQLATSREVLTTWIESLPASTGIPLDRTWIAGFSQGGAMTLEIGLDLPVAGLIVMSGYLHQNRSKPTQAAPPVAIVHGRQDDVVPISAARQIQARLTEWGVDVRYQEFDMGHSIVPEVLNVVRKFVTDRDKL